MYVVVIIGEQKRGVTGPCYSVLPSLVMLLQFYSKATACRVTEQKAILENTLKR